MATDIELAAEAQRKAEEELKKKKLEEEGLLDAYSTQSGDIYTSAKTTSEGLLGGAKTDIESLYDRGYSDLQSLIGEQSAAQMKESVRPIEGQLAKQGLLGGPSGALNEALAGAAERIRTTGLGKLQDFVGNRTSALADVYGNTAQQLASLEQAFGGQMQGLEQTALAQALANTQAGLNIANEYGMAGLESALGTNKIVLEQEGQQDLAQTQADLQAELIAAQGETAKADLANRQQQWERAYQSALQTTYSNLRAQGWTDAVAYQMAQQQAAAQVGPKPTS